MNGTLHLVGTPIGNLGDLSDRARETLASVDLVAAEDTRRTGRLLDHIGVRARLVSLFEGNEARRTAELVRVLRGGRDVALVSDAGMPTISDPGERLVRACAEAGILVRVVPGPSAVVAALAVSGLATERFAFEGFLPRRVGERRARLAALAGDPRTLVLFESPNRVAALLRDVLEVLGDRRAAIARELTKLHEEVRRGRVSELLEGLADGALRGEVVVVLEGGAAEPPSWHRILDEARALVADGLKLRAAARAVAERHGVPANELYRALVGSAPGSGSRERH